MRSATRSPELVSVVVVLGLLGTVFFLGSESG
jgi:hypothetical protein